MAKSLQVTVTNPDDLNTLQGELVTQNYNLEILGLKNPADFRKFSKSLMMLDRILKETNDKVDNGLNKKLNKGSYEGDADDLKREIDGKEPAFEKNSGFNKEKTDDYNGNDTNKLFTQEGANSLYKEVETELEKKANLSGANFTGQVFSPLFGIKDKHGRQAGGIYYDDEYKFITFSNTTPSSSSLILKDNGDLVVRANNLTVPHGYKDVVETINWMYNYDQMKIYSPICVDNTNAAIYPGTCFFNTATLNTPCSYGQLIAFVNDANAHNNSGNWLTQLALGTDSNIYHRHKVNDSSFTGWSKLYDSSNVDLDVNKLTTNSKNIIGGINELSNRFKNREVIMNTKNGSAGSLLYMNVDYRQYSLLVVSAELDGSNSTILHQQILCVDTSISQQRMSINQWGSPNANSIELAFTSGDGSVRIDNCLAGAIVKIEGIR